MDIKRRKIGYYYIVLIGGGSLFEVDHELERIFNYSIEKSRKDRKYDLNASKFCVLAKNDRIINVRKVIFESAKHSYRADLMDRNNASKRKNPKKMKEGETHKTHALIQCKDGDAVMISEITQSGLKAREIIQYLNYYKTKYEEENRGTQLNYKFHYEVIAKDNFQEELDNLKRVISATVHIDKKVLGEHALNFSDRIFGVKEDIIVEIKSKRQEDIKHTANDIFRKFAGSDTEITKMVIKGKNENDNDSKLDTTFIEKQEWVRAHLDSDTGEVHSRTMFIEMLEILNN